MRPSRSGPRWAPPKIRTGAGPSMARLRNLVIRGAMPDRTGRVGGTPTRVPDRYRIASPVTHVGPRAPATYLAHGTRDQVVPINQSLDLARRLRQAGVPHRLVGLRGSNHGYDLFGGGWNTQTTLATLDDFLGTWLNRPTLTGLSDP